MNVARTSGIEPSELRELAEALDQIRERLDVAAGRQRARMPARAWQSRDLTRCATFLLKLRAKRVSQFGVTGGLFGEPAYDMLLDLYGSRGRAPLSVSALCEHTSAPATTALRYLAALEANGMVVREPDPDDRRRSFVHLTDEAVLRLEEHLSVAAEGMEALLTGLAG